MKEICTLELGRWSATVSKIKAGTLEASPDATLYIEVRGDGRFFGHGHNGRPVDCKEVDPGDRETPEEWAKKQGLVPLSARDVFDIEFLTQISQRLARHIEQGGSWERWVEKELMFVNAPGWKQTH